MKLKRMHRLILDKASRPDGIPETHFTFSGVGGSEIGELIREGMIERRDKQLSRGGADPWLFITEAGRKATAK